MKDLLISANLMISNSLSKINNELISLYWSIGKLINDYKSGNNFNYGDNVIKKFSDDLTIKYGKGFNKRNIERMCRFNKIFDNLTLGSQSQNDFENWWKNNKFQNINWSHIRELLIFKDMKIINFYLKKVENKNLTKNELIYKIKSKSYERTIVNQKNGPIKNEIEKKLKDPIILNIDNKIRSEKELESKILNNLSNFKKEIGSNVMFFESQYKININNLIHKIDLVFFDNEINSYILVDLKINKVANKDIHQMQMYIDYFNKYIEKNKYNKTIGIILCLTKDIRIESNNYIYQIRYLNEIPKEKNLHKKRKVKSFSLFNRLFFYLTSPKWGSYH